MANEILKKGYVTFTVQICKDKVTKNRIITKEAIMKALESVKPGTPILTNEYKIKCIGHVIAEPEIVCSCGEPDIIGFSVRAMINDFSKIDNAMIELNLNFDEISVEGEDDT